MFFLLILNCPTPFMFLKKLKVSQKTLLFTVRIVYMFLVLFIIYFPVHFLAATIELLYLFYLCIFKNQNNALYFSRDRILIYQFLSQFYLYYTSTLNLKLYHAINLVKPHKSKSLRIPVKLVCKTIIVILNYQLFYYTL